MYNRSYKTVPIMYSKIIGDHSDPTKELLSQILLIESQGLILIFYTSSTGSNTNGGQTLGPLPYSQSNHNATNRDIFAINRENGEGPAVPISFYEILS